MFWWNICLERLMRRARRRQTEIFAGIPAIERTIGQRNFAKVAISRGGPIRVRIKEHAYAN
jgi:hypothetical protein